MTIAILYICTGKYPVFWSDFYLSCEQNFIPAIKKKYLVFTDSSSLAFEKTNGNIRKIFQKDLGWPDNTLKRYHLFLNYCDLWQDCDYVFFFNANLVFQQEITAAEILPGPTEQLVAVQHPGFFNKTRKKFTYETDPQSAAFIPADRGRYYFAGGLNGGRTAAFRKAAETMRDSINRDAERQLVAIWHDESHWNKYLLDRSDLKILSPAYLYPAGWRLPFTPKILLRDKTKFGGDDFLKGRITSRQVKLKNKIIKTLVIVKHFLKL